MVHAVTRSGAPSGGSDNCRVVTFGAMLRPPLGLRNCLRELADETDGRLGDIRC